MLRFSFPSDQTSLAYDISVMSFIARLAIDDWNKRNDPFYKKCGINVKPSIKACFDYLNQKQYGCDCEWCSFNDRV